MIISPIVFLLGYVTLAFLVISAVGVGFVIGSRANTPRKAILYLLIVLFVFFLIFNFDVFRLPYLLYNCRYDFLCGLHNADINYSNSLLILILITSGILIGFIGKKVSSIFH